MKAAEARALDSERRAAESDKRAAESDKRAAEAERRAAAMQAERDEAMLGAERERDQVARELDCIRLKVCGGDHRHSLGNCMLSLSVSVDFRTVVRATVCVLIRLSSMVLPACTGGGGQAGVSRRDSGAGPPTQRRCGSPRGLGARFHPRGAHSASAILFA